MSEPAKNNHADEQRAASPLPSSTPCGIGISFQFLRALGVLAVREIVPDAINPPLPFVCGDILMEVRHHDALIVTRDTLMVIDSQKKKMRIHAVFSAIYPRL